jgi:hypothetical protein
MQKMNDEIQFKPPPSKNTRWERQFDRLWMLYMTIFLCSLHFEQKFFDRAFPNALDYALVILVWIGAIMLLYAGCKNLSSQIIQIVLTVCAILGSLVWLHYAAALPSTDMNETTCKTWDCHLLQQLAAGSMTDTWATGWFGQTLIILGQFTIMPALFMVLIQRYKGSGSHLVNESYDALPLMGISFLLIGLCEVFFPSFVAMFIVSIVNFIFALCISQLPILNQNSEEQLVDSSPASPQYVQFNWVNFLQNLLMLAGIVVFVVSFIEINSYIFERFWEMAIGVGLIYLWNRIVLPKITRSDKDRIWWQDFFFYTCLVVTMAMGWHFYNSNSDLITKSGISPIVAGLFFGYFSIWLNQYLKNPNPAVSSAISIKFLKKPIGDLFLLNLMILLVFIGSLFEINPRSTGVFITFLPGLIVAIIGWVLVISKKITPSMQ